MNLRNSTLVGVAVAALLIPVGVSSYAGGYSVREPNVAKVRVSSSMFLEAVGCENGGGPTITLSGTRQSAGNVAARVRFVNPSGKNSKDSVEVQGLMTLDISDLSESFVKQPSMGGVGGNPYIYVQLSGDPSLSLLGRCVQSDINFKGGKGKATPFRWSTHNSADVPVEFTGNGMSSQCTPKQTDFTMNDVNIVGRPDGNNGGISATFLFSNRGDLAGKTVNDNDFGKGNHYSADQADVKVDVSVGMGQLRKRGPDGNVRGIGGNPFIELFLSSDGQDTGFEALGRCKDILG